MLKYEYIFFDCFILFRTLKCVDFENKYEINPGLLEIELSMNQIKSSID